MKKCAAILMFYITLALAGLAGAQMNAPASSIGDREIQRQQEQERQRRQELEDQAPDIHFQTEIQGQEEGDYPGEEPCFVIHEIRLEDEGLDFQWALEAAEDALGRCLGSRGVNMLMNRVQNRIVEEGFATTRVVASPQDLAGGVLALDVIPGRVSGIRFSEDSGRSVVLASSVPISPGDILNIRDVEQALENLKRVPTVEADIQILPGENEGESELVVTWRQARPVRFSLSADDSGSRYTGRYQATATVSVDNLTGFSDMFYFSASRNMERHKPYGSRAHSFYYSIPWGYYQLVFNTGRYEYHQKVAGYFTGYEYSGVSRQQWALDKLVSRDRLSIGGRYFVRGYDGDMSLSAGMNLC